MKSQEFPEVGAAVFDITHKPSSVNKTAEGGKERGDVKEI